MLLVCGHEGECSTARSAQTLLIGSESAYEMKACQVEMRRLILSSHVHEIALQNHSDQRVKEESCAQPQRFHLLAKKTVASDLGSVVSVDVLAGKKGWHTIQAALRCWMCNAKGQDNTARYLLHEDLPLVRHSVILLCFPVLLLI